MKIFNDKRQAFDLKAFKRENITRSSTKLTLQEGYADLENSVSKHVQDYKFRKLQNNFQNDQLEEKFIKSVDTKA